MSLGEISYIKKQFQDSAERAFIAGADGVELHACHFYLLCQFLNTRINKRTDAHGLNPERLCVEIIKGIRNITSKNFIIGVRLGAFEPTLDDSIKNARLLEEAGADYLHISFGFQTESNEYKPGDYPYNPYIFSAQEIQKNVSIPLFAVTGIDTPELA